MNVDLNYLGQSAITSKGENQTLSLSPNLARGKVYFDAQLTEPLKSDQADVVKAVKLMDPKSDFFDLQMAAPSLLAKGETDIQPRYKIELNVTATDVNTELTDKFGKPLPGKIRSGDSAHSFSAIHSVTPDGLVGTLAPVKS